MSGYEPSDPKSPDYHDRMADVWDNRDKTQHRVLRCACSRKELLTCPCDVPHYRAAHIITDESEEILATYNLCVVGTSWLPTRVVADLPAMLEAVEEDLSDLLPDGFRATIKEWSSE